MEHVVIHYHEIALKGGNRGRFEERLVKNIRAHLGRAAQNVRRSDSRIFLTLKKPFDAEIKTLLGQIFGICSFLPVSVTKPSMKAMEAAVSGLLEKQKLNTFVVRTKRSDKGFSKTSEQVSRELGAFILDNFGGKVNLKEPETTVYIEILPKQALITTERYSGPGGLPVGVSGKVVAMLSGGIDSPVAAWKVMKRGCEVVFAHFHSYPHTSRASVIKVKQLAKIVGSYQSESVIYLLPLAEAQRQIVMQNDPKYRVLLYRRLMLRVVNELARRERAAAIVTGESIGQVASQTIPNLQAVESASGLPVFRPLIGDDKEEIIFQAKRLGTYDTSIQPHDDCCTLFVPRHPSTKARIEDLDREEQKFDFKLWTQEILNKAERELI